MKVYPNYSNEARKVIYGLIIFGFALLLSHCVSGPQPNSNLNDVLAKESVVQGKVDELNHKILASAVTSSQPQDYVIAEGDLLDMTVFEAQELATEARVSATGTVTLPLLGAVEVKGLTLRQAEQKVANAYRAEYLEDPHVSLFVKEQQGGKVTVTGAVQKPGAYDCFSQQRVLDVLAIAGGLSEKAGRTVQVRRNTQDSNGDSVFLIDLDELVKGGRSDLNIQIQRGDTIFVPEAGVVYVDGAVLHPGNYPIRQAMTVREAIVAAGGFHSTADQNAIKLVHYAGNGKREVIQLSGTNVDKDSANSIEVSDRDIIFVESNKLASLIYGLHLNFGFAGFGYSPPAR